MNTSTLESLSKLQTKQKAELQLTTDKIKAEIKILVNEVTTKSHKKYTILTRPDGLSIHVPKTFNNYRERTISWYDKVKGDVASENSRESLYDLKLWLVLVDRP